MKHAIGISGKDSLAAAYVENKGITKGLTEIKGRG